MAVLLIGHTYYYNYIHKQDTGGLHTREVIICLMMTVIFIRNSLAMKI